MEENKEIMQQALNRLKGNWLLVIAAMFLSYVINCIFQFFFDFTFNSESSSILGSFFSVLIATLLLGAQIFVGEKILFMTIARGQKPEIKVLFEVFKSFKRYFNVLVAYLLLSIFVTLGFALFIIPGIIISLRLYPTFFILAENPHMDGLSALKKSWDMMKKHKVKVVLLNSRFLGWTILSVLTFGIGFIWLMPYIYTSNALFYLKIKDEQEKIT